MLNICPIWLTQSVKLSWSNLKTAYGFEIAGIASLPGCSNLDAAKSASEEQTCIRTQHSEKFKLKDRHPYHPFLPFLVFYTGMQTCWHKSLSAVLQCSSEEFLSMILCCTAWKKCKLFQDFALSYYRIVHIILSKSAVSRLCTWP